MDNPTLLCLSAGYELVNLEEVAQEKRHRNPTDEEVHVIKKDNMWDHVSIPKDFKVIIGKWMHKTKKNVTENFAGHKAKLVANGYNKKVDCDNVFIPSRSSGYQIANNLSNI